jgi:hypothetical protein
MKKKRKICRALTWFYGKRSDYVQQVINFIALQFPEELATV